MNALAKIQDAVRALSDKEFAELAAWFWQFEEERRDRRIERDQESGPLQHRKEKARADFVAGVRRGMQELDEGKGIPHDQVKAEFAAMMEERQDSEDLKALRAAKAKEADAATYSLREIRKELGLGK